MTEALCLPLLLGLSACAKGDQVVMMGDAPYRIVEYTKGEKLAGATKLPPEFAAEPPVGGCIPSENYGYRMCKVADPSVVPLNHGNVVRPHHSKWSNVNSDGTLFFLGKNGETPPGRGKGQAVVFRVSDNSVFRVLSDINGHENSDLRWDRTGNYPRRLYVTVNGSQWHQYDMSEDGTSAERTLIHDFSKDFPALGGISSGGDGETDITGRYWPFRVMHPYHAVCRNTFNFQAAIVYDKETDTIVSKLDRDAYIAMGGDPAVWDSCNFKPDAVDVSPLGTKMVVTWSGNRRKDPFDGPHAYNFDLSNPVKVCNAATHSGWGFDFDGSELFVCQVNSNNWEGVDADTITATNIHTGEKKIILYHEDLGWDVGGWHFSRPYELSMRGWILMTFYASQSGRVKSPLRNQAVMLELKSYDQHPRIWRIADLKNNIESSSKAYDREAFAPLSPSGRSIYVGIDLITGVSGSEGNYTFNSVGNVATYKIELPLYWWHVLNGTQPPTPEETANELRQRKLRQDRK